MTAAPRTPTPDGRAVAGLIESAVAHVLRTPLHAVLGLGELLTMTELDDDQHRLVEQVMAATDELLAGCNRLSLVLGTLSGAAPPAAQPFELTGMLADVQAMAGAGTGMTVHVDPGLPHTVVGDVEALRCALSELVDNAVRHGRRPIAVTVTADGPVTAQRMPVRFTVSDAGAGLSEDRIAALTAEHVPVPTDASHLGLYLVSRLARRVGGKLSAGPKGTVSLVTHLRLPTIARPAAPEPEVAALRVLLVEDNAVNRLLTERQMARLGHSLRSVTTGVDGVAAALADEYDVILMDRHLPDLDGIEATKAIRDAEGDRRTPIVAVTADAKTGHREECLAAGMDGFLTKPVSLEHLKAALTALVPPRPVSTPAGVDIDLTALGLLAQELDGGADLAEEVVHTYLSELPGRRLRLQTAIRQAVPRGAIVAADGLRAASLTVGAVGVARICADVITAATAGDLTASRAMLPDLLDVCQRTADNLGTLAAAGRLVA
jgi:CheY-like chemotaxis protein/anti-sigma regulatory factor (Ser/Thr protein kinase)